MRILLITLFIILGMCSSAISSERSDRRSDDSLHDMFGGPRKGVEAPNLILHTLDGEEVNLSEYIGKEPIVLEFGSYTCPVFREKHESLERLFTEYGDRATFFLIYSIEAHPKGDPSPYSNTEWVTEPNRSRGILYRQPANKDGRTKLAEDARADLNITVPILVDDMENSAWQAYGKAPNAAYLIGVDGRIKLRQGWFEPSEFRRVLERELAK